jgi:hypothetical protein
MGTKGNLNSNLGATESLTSQEVAMAVLIRMMLVRNKHFCLLERTQK